MMNEPDSVNRKTTGQRLKTEHLAYWFFRLNGCLTIVNFLVHHERRGHEGTDVDILATRLPYRRELAMSDRPMQDHPVFESDGLIDLIIAEIKFGRCALNGPWTDPNRRNVQRVLHAVGAFPDSAIERVAESLYSGQYYEDERFRLRLFALGQEINKDLATPPVVQLTWDEVITFIYGRLYGYRNQKSQHNQWDRTGRLLYQKMRQCRTPEQFLAEIKLIMTS